MVSSFLVELSIVLVKGGGKMITISPGHWKIGTGAVGLIDEVTEARKVVEHVTRILESRNIQTSKVVDNTSTNQRENLTFLISKHNKTNRLLDVSVHFNAVKGIETRAFGTEVLYKDDAIKSLASYMSKAIATSAGFIDRGAKKRLDLAFLNQTNKNAILIEVCFVNSTVDVSLYERHFEAICQAIAQTLAQFVQPNVKIFSSPALHQRVEAIFLDKKKVNTLLQQGISNGAFLPIWKEKSEQGTLSFIDFCGLCVLLHDKKK